MATSKATTTARKTTRRKLVQPANGAFREPPMTVPPLDPDRLSGTLLDDSPNTPISAGEQDTLMDFLRSFTDAAEVNVRVYRAVKNKPLAYVYECSPETFSLDSLRDDYGGGEFRVYIYRDGELLKNVRTMVEPPRRQGVSELDAALAGITARQDKTDKLLEMMAARLTAPAPAVPSLGDTLSRLDLPAVIGAVGSLMALMKPPAPPPMPPAPPPPDPMAGVEMFMKAFELARELKGDGGGESSLMDVVRDFVKSPMLAQAIQQAGQTQPPALPAPHMQQPHQQQRGPMPRRPPGMPEAIQTPAGPVFPPGQHQPQPQATNGAAPEVPHAELSGQGIEMPVVNTEQASIVGYLEMLTNLAASEADPQVYAVVILDQLDDEAIIGMLNWGPDPVTALLNIYPPAQPYRAWFEELVGLISSEFEDDQTPVVGGGGPVVDALQSGGPTTPDDVGDRDATGPGSALPAG